MKIADAMKRHDPRLRVTNDAENRWMVRDPNTGLYSVYEKRPRQRHTTVMAEDVSEDDAVAAILTFYAPDEIEPETQFASRPTWPLWDMDTWHRIVNAVEASGQSRVQTQPSTNDADFLAGALAAMLAMALPPNKVPASWTLGLVFTKKSPLRPEPAAAVAPTAETNE